MKQIFIDLIDAVLVNYKNINVNVTYSSASYSRAVWFTTKEPSEDGCSFYFYESNNLEDLSELRDNLLKLLSNPEVNINEIKELNIKFNNYDK